jgi:hypothetical protein
VTCASLSDGQAEVAMTMIARASWAVARVIVVER